MRYILSFMLVFLAVQIPIKAIDLDRKEIFNFQTGRMPDGVVYNTTIGKPITHGKGKGLEVTYQPAEWPNILFQAPAGGWNWNGWAGLAIEVYNPEKEPVDFSIRVDNAAADGYHHCNHADASVAPGKTISMEMRFKTALPETLWGMRGLPLMPPCGEGEALDLEHITAFQIFLTKPAAPRRLVIQKVSLFRWNTPEGGIPMPFIDTFGQYKFDDWPGKIHQIDQLKKEKEKEEKAWEKTPQLKDRDRWGGWAKGPKVEATGWFRTEKIAGKWWLVTPDGTLFFSNGLDCIATWEQTFVEGRERWFEGLPSADAPEAAAYGQVNGVHSHAEPIGGKGKTFSFYRANLIRKYGDTWKEDWRKSVYPRMRHWGFNTIANWSQEDVALQGDIPYTVSGGIGGVPCIENSTGYWAKMIDVYAPEFEKAATATAAAVTERHKDNPRCIGYFIDNELAWEGVKAGVLASPSSQPARQAFLAQLTQKYGAIQALNEAWHTQFSDWNSIVKPEPANKAHNDDMSAFLYAFAYRYFSTLAAAIHQYAPHQLYLGCRFAGTPDEAVKACADAADVVSFNIYRREVPPKKWCNLFDKPAIIGEFHFGALDRGMFHCGLVRTDNQKDRAKSYRRYVESVADHPLFVGCHWFQYVDEPVTGRCLDGENYSIGFLNVTDTPYPELVKAARTVHQAIYKRRFR